MKLAIMAVISSLMSGSLPSRGAWIEIGSGRSVWVMPTRWRPSRGAWIEVRDITGTYYDYAMVAPLTGSVD